MDAARSSVFTIGGGWHGWESWRRQLQRDGEAIPAFVRFCLEESAPVPAAPAAVAAEASIVAEMADATVRVSGRPCPGGAYRRVPCLAPEPPMLTPPPGLRVLVATAPIDFR